MEVERQSDLQEFQYGKDVFQTTTNKVSDTVGTCLDCLAMVT